jgi:hypothetical protein
MSYIDVDKVKVENGKLNHLLICLICQGILIDPLECSKCQRGYCSGCISQMTIKKCAICHETGFTSPHIQTKYNLEELKFETSCCRTVITYHENKDHYRNCINAVRCTYEGCGFSALPGDGFDQHIRSCLFQKVKCLKCNKEILFKEKAAHEMACITMMRSQTLVTNNEMILNIEPDTEAGNKCEKCHSREYKYMCYKCGKNICKPCTKNLICTTLCYLKLLKCMFSRNRPGFFMTFFGKKRMSNSTFACFLIFYILLGWIIDLYMLVLLLTCFIVFLLFPIPLIIYYAVYVPIYLVVWSLCLKKRRICKECTRRLH